MFKLKRPCENCPFKKGQGSRFRLNVRRLAGIFDAPAFQCHKTVQYGEDEDGDPTHNQGDHPQQCAGLMAILHREDHHNQIMQVAIRFGEFNPELLDPDREAYDTWRQATKAHLEGVEPKTRTYKTPKGFNGKRKS
jgi:hypothetical protein